jgi:nitrogen regulatory protein P-II 1
VPSEQAELIFERAYLAGKLDTPGMGLITMSPLEKMATYVPHEIVERFSSD